LGFDRTIYWVEVWQQELLTSNLIRHEPSNTFYGGKTGVVHIFRALIQIYLNCCAVRGDFNPPEDPPPNYDLSRFNVNDHDQIAKWIDDWILAIKECTKILSQTSDERKRGLAEIQLVSQDDGSETLLDARSTPVPKSSKSSKSATRTINTSRPSKAGGSKQKSRGRKLFSDIDDHDGDDSSDSDPEANYDDLDQTSLDGDSSDEDAWREFEEKYLKDDIFPPDDLIGLRARYSFDPDMPRTIILNVDEFMQVTKDG
jgi:hypothetical protein